jgi:hypothetical protein
MAYDATKPVNNSPIVAVELRTQFAGLKTLIDAVPTSPAMNTVLNANTSGAVDEVPTLVLTISNPPTQLQVQAIMERFNLLLEALKRV